MFFSICFYAKSNTFLFRSAGALSKMEKKLVVILKIRKYNFKFCCKELLLLILFVFAILIHFILKKYTKIQR